MASIIIHTTNDQDISLLQELATKMGFKSQVLDNEAKEELVIAQAIEENDPADHLQFNEALEYYKGLDKAR
ncbi:hypothetical protein [Desertivirga brevis]|uniref:hypothetical protein n=1 Tax=Desertivirga brevis TaxID=2810310 RepID=UPI001A966187|nr:hypothetical protein [Pedobacter sp. SYSU D00873]